MGDTAYEAMLELIQMDQAEKVTATGIVISFLAKKPLAEIKEHAKAMGYDSTDIIMQPPKPAHFTVTDPDGLIIEISEN